MYIYYVLVFLKGKPLVKKSILILSQILIGQSINQEKYPNFVLYSDWSIHWSGKAI